MHNMKETNMYLAPESVVLEIDAERVICSSGEGDYPGIPSDKVDTQTGWTY